MKKNGFTLAEVLITLAIIGVVATLTLPALMNNTAEQQAVTAFKKGLNTLTIAAETNEAIDNFNFDSIGATSDINNSDAGETPSLYAMLATRGAVDYQKSGTQKAYKLGRTGDKTGNFCVYFRDGSLLMFPDTAGTTDAEKKVEDDNLTHGISAVFDYNGDKMPNALSNCVGSSNVEAVDDKSGDCSNRAKRVIKDRFAVRLRGHYAFPNGAAARWAFNK